MIIIHDLVKEDVSIDTCAARCNVYIVVPKLDSKREKHLIAGSKNKVQRTKSPRLALCMWIKIQ